MKMKKTAALIALLTACVLQSTAQSKVPPINEPNYNKAKLFNDVPDKLELNLSTLEKLLQLKVGDPVNTSIASGFRLVGTVISKSSPVDASVRSIVIKSSTRQQATLTFSKIVKQDGTIRYNGRMLSKDGGDVLEIVQDGNRYVILKKGYYDMINE